MHNPPQSVFDSILSIEDVIVDILDISLVCPIETPDQIIAAVSYLNSAILSLLEETLPRIAPTLNTAIRSMPYYTDPLDSGDDYI